MVETGRKDRWPTMNDTVEAGKRGRPKGTASRTDRERREELILEIERVERREERRLVSIARKNGFFDRRFRNGEIDELFSTAMRTNPGRKDSTLRSLVRRLARLTHGSRRGETRRKILLGAFLTAQCRHSPTFHVTCAADIRDWLAKASDPDAAGRNSDALSEWLGHPGSASDDPGVGDTEARHRAHNHRMILLGAWVLERREALPELAECIGSQLRGFVEANPKTADRNRKLLADLL